MYDSIYHNSSSSIYWTGLCQRTECCVLNVHSCTVITRLYQSRNEWSMVLTCEGCIVWWERERNFCNSKLRNRCQFQCMDTGGSWSPTAAGSWEGYVSMGLFPPDDVGWAVPTGQEGHSKQGKRQRVQRCGGHTRCILFKVLQIVHVRSRKWWAEFPEWWHIEGFGL